MTRAQILPTVLMTIDVMAGVVYAFNGDLKRCIYWLAAAVLTATVTY